MPIPDAFPVLDLHQAGVRLQSASLETTSRAASVDEAIGAQFAAGTCVYITALPRDQLRDGVAAAARLRRAGLNPVPHIGARYFRTPYEFEQTLARFAGEAGVDQALVIAGDIDHARGPFGSSLDLLRTGLLEKTGIRRIGLAGYPEGHPRVSDDALQQALATKIDRLRQVGLDAYVVTQFCFAPEPITAWLSRFSDRFPDVPVHVGLAGPASVSTLLRYGLSCGVGASLQALRRNMKLGRLLVEATPVPILDSIARNPAVAHRVARFHIFTFGGIRRTAEWLRTGAGR
jgi:methylenetetrahydrofolate reductase (NADPH)